MAWQDDAQILLTRINADLATLTQLVADSRDVSQPTPEPIPDPTTPGPIPEPIPVPDTTPAPESWQLTATTSGTGPVKIVAAFTAPKDFTGKVLGDVEVFTPTGQRVGQWFEESSSVVSAGDTFTIASELDITGLADGQYSIQQGIFNAGWQGQYAWRAEGVTLTLPVVEESPLPEPGVPGVPEPVPTDPVPEPVPAKGGFYVDGGTVLEAAQAARKAGREADAKLLDWLASKPQAIWFNGVWDGDKIKSACKKALDLDQEVTLCLYNVPGRDAGNHSAGGAADVKTYLESVDVFCAAVGETKAIIAIEPDAVNLPDYLDETRIDCLNGAMERISKLPNVKAYIDAGHSNWRGEQEIAKRLKSLTIPANIGFALNVSSFQGLKYVVPYGKTVSGLLKGKHFIVDTSRNGNNLIQYEWCNPQDQTAGPEATHDTGEALVDAYVWIKRPGESDGPCWGGPGAGQWFEAWALNYVKASQKK